MSLGYKNPKKVTVIHRIPQQLPDITARSLFIFDELHLLRTDFLNLKMSFYFTKSGACSQAAHYCYQIFRLNFTLLLFVVQGEAFFKLCKEERELNLPSTNITKCFLSTAKKRFNLFNT